MFGKALPPRRRAGGEDGFALILALVMLFVMGLLGVMIFNVSSPEMQISRNYRFRQEAMYAADRGLEYSRTDTAVLDAADAAGVGGSVNLPLAGVTLQVGNTNAGGTVSLVVEKAPPPIGSGFSDNMAVNYYVMNVTGAGPVNSTVQVEANYGRIVPKN